MTIEQAASNAPRLQKFHFPVMSSTQRHDAPRSLSRSAAEPHAYHMSTRNNQMMHQLKGCGQHLTGCRALMWQSLLSSDYVGVLGMYEPLIGLLRKAAIFLFEYHNKDFFIRVSRQRFQAFPRCLHRRIETSILMCMAWYKMKR
jgi:hypothetical protein